MWQRFTKSSRATIFHAQEEAGKLGENWVSTEHLLLGLIHEHDNVACHILERLGIDLSKIRSETMGRVQSGEGLIGQDMQLTSSAKQVIDFAYDEAKQLNSSYIGTEHLLLGIVREARGCGAQVLASLGMDLEKTRDVLKEMQDSGNERVRDARPPAAPDRQKITEHTDQVSQEPSDTQGPSWQKFTERARKVIFYAQEEAGRLGENYVSTEHLLLGLVREEDNVASQILSKMNISLKSIRSEILAQAAHGDGTVEEKQLSTRAKRVIELAFEEARQLNNNYIGTEHLLLGLIREQEGLAGRVLAKLGSDLGRATVEVKTLQQYGKDQVSTPLPRERSAFALAKVMQSAFAEAKAAGQEAGTEHLLIALIKEEGDGAKALANLGVTLESIQQEIDRLRHAKNDKNSDNEDSSA